VRIHIPSTYPPESLVLFVMSTWHVLVALLISRVGVLRRDPVSSTDAVAAQGAANAVALVTPASVSATAAPVALQEQNA
jgi:hypothetical protein